MTTNIHVLVDGSVGKRIGANEKMIKGKDKERGIGGNEQRSERECVCVRECKTEGEIQRERER